MVQIFFHNNLNIKLDMFWQLPFLQKLTIDVCDAIDDKYLCLEVIALRLRLVMTKGNALYSYYVLKCHLVVGICTFHE